MYLNPFKGILTKKFPQLQKIKGGILADDMVYFFFKLFISIKLMKNLCIGSRQNYNNT